MQKRKINIFLYFRISTSDALGGKLVYTNKLQKKNVSGSRETKTPGMRNPYYAGLCLNSVKYNLHIKLILKNKEKSQLTQSLCHHNFTTVGYLQ